MGVDHIGLLLSSIGPRTCLDFWAQITLVLIATSLDQGSIDILFGNNVFSSITYSPAAVSVLFQLALCRLILLDMIGLGFFDTAPVVPETVSGAITVSSTELGGGNDHAKVTTEVVGLKLLDPVNGIEVDIASSKAEINANGNTGDLSLDLNMSAGYWIGPRMDISGFGWPTRLDWVAFSGFYEFAGDRKEQLQGSTTPVAFTKDVIDSGSSPDPLDYEFTAGATAWNYNADNDDFRCDLDNAIHYEIKDVKNVFGGKIGSIGVFTPLGTNLRYLPGTNGFLEERLQVTAGFVDISGTGDFSLLSHPFWGGKVSPGDTDGIGGPFRDAITFEGELGFKVQTTYRF